MKQILKYSIIFRIVFGISSIYNLKFAQAETHSSALIKNVAYGGITGASIGASTLSFSQKPIEDLTRIGYGAAAGAFSGIRYSLCSGSRVAYQHTGALNFDHGKLKTKIPTIEPIYTEHRTQNDIALNVVLVSGHFN